MEVFLSYNQAAGEQFFVHIFLTKLITGNRKTRNLPVVIHTSGNECTCNNKKFKHTVKVNISMFDISPGMHCFIWLPSLLKHFIFFLTIPQWKNLIGIHSVY